MRGGELQLGVWGGAGGGAAAGRVRRCTQLVRVMGAVRRCTDRLGMWGVALMVRVQGWVRVRWDD